MSGAVARILFRVSRFLLMAAPAGLLGPKLGGLLFIGVAAFAATALQQEAKDEATLEKRLKQMPSWVEARRSKGGPVLAAWQKWLLVWGSWGWKGEPLLAHAWFNGARLIPSDRSYMLVDDDNRPTTTDRIAVLALLAGLLAMPLSVIAVGWIAGGSLGFQSGSEFRHAFDVTLILLILTYVVLTQLNDQIFLFTSVRANDPELEALCKPAELRISYFPQPAHRWMRAGLLDRPWRKVVLINAIDYERLGRDELQALVAHEMVHLRERHDLLFGTTLRLLLVGLALVYWTLDLVGLLPALPNLGTAQSLVVFVGVILLGLFALPYAQGRYAERRAYLGAAARVGAAPVLRVLRLDTTPHPSWLRAVMSELDKQADADARRRAEGGPR